MGKLIMMKSKAKPKRYQEFSAVVSSKGTTASKRFLNNLSLKGSEWEVWVDYCYSWDSPGCRLFRSYMAED